MQPEGDLTPPRRRATEWDPFAMTMSDQEHELLTNQEDKEILITHCYEVNDEQVEEIEIHGDPSVVSSEDEEGLLSCNYDDHN